MEIRLNKFMAHTGIGSRRNCDELIEAGRVSLNGEVVTKLGIMIDQETDEVRLDGERVRLKVNTSPIYVLLNKPKGIVATAKDESGRPTVVDLVQIPGRRLYPVGRLDKASEGLILLTDDGDFALKMTHPRYEQEKRYKIWATGQFTPETLDTLRNGSIVLDGKPVQDCWVRADRRGYNRVVFKFRLREGRNRQIRRMLSHVGITVDRLVRMSEGPLTLGVLSSGQWRKLLPDEVEELKRSVDTPPRKRPAPRKPGAAPARRASRRRE